MMNWKFAIEDKVYHSGRNQNGIVINRVYYEFKDRAEYEYNVCFQNGGGVEYVGVSASWLKLGHKDIID